MKSITEVKQVKELHTTKDVNKHLADGWFLYKVFSSTCFIVVKYVCH